MEVDLRGSKYMYKLDKPSILIEDFYIKLIGKKNNNEKNDFLKSRLLEIKDILILEENKYIKLGESCNLHRFKKETKKENYGLPEAVTKKEMENLYSQDFVSKPGAKDDGRKIYDYLRSLAMDELCPYCSVSFAKTLDHYFPKSKFPKLAITPANLVPCCRDCNTTKDTIFSNVESELFIHPYFEDISSFRWLKCTVEREIWPISFTYEVVNNNDSNNILFQRIYNQFRVLGLNNVLSNKANRTFRYRLSSIIKNYETGGIDSAKEFIKESELSCRSFELNSWEACMYSALLRSDWFLTSAIQDLKERYDVKT